MKNRFWIAILIVMTFALGGCADRMIRDEDDSASKSLVFGYVDMQEAPVSLDWLTIRQVLPKTDKPYWHASTDDGMFWNPHIKGGAYQMDAFGGHSGWRNANYTFSFPRQYAEGGRFKIQKSGIYFLGSYKYKDVKTGIFEPGKFDFERVDSPTERELLERLLKFTESNAWKARINQRIAELSK